MYRREVWGGQPKPKVEPKHGGRTKATEEGEGARGKESG